MMRPSARSSPSTAENSLALLCDEITQRLQAGESVDIEEYAAAHSEYAEQLRQVFPTIAALAEIGAEQFAGQPLASSDAANGDSQRTLGDFCLIREIGRGGMGIVYEAEQLSLSRRVAVKVLPLAGMLDKRALARFQNEARAAATLCHQHIVPVYFVGSERGVHFYAMQLIEGTSLAEVIGELRTKAETGTQNSEQSEDESRFPLSTFRFNDTVAAALSTARDKNPRDYFRRIAEIGIQIAEGLQHAHDSGILHRDIKPGNVLLDDDGKAWLTDFGLARLEADASMTATGDFLGTLRYMSPEQVSGGQGTDVRSDVYSLGVTLYELTALEPAFPQTEREQLATAISSTEPRRPAAHNASIPRELETIILKTIEKAPQDRYATAEELADDLRRFLQHEPIRARRSSWLARSRKWTRRHHVAVTSALVTLLVTLSVSTFLLARAWQRERDLRASSVQSQNRAERNLDLAQSAVDEMYTQLATQWLTQETVASSLQHQFLNKALGIYKDLANRPIFDERSRQTAAFAFERIGEIRQFLVQDKKAVEALQKSIDLSRQFGEALSTETMGALARRYHKLATSYDSLGRWRDAAKAIEEGAEFARFAYEHEPENTAYRRELAVLCVSAADVAVSQHDFGRAESELNTARTIHQQLPEEHRGSLLWRLVRHEVQLLESDSLRQQQHLDKAKEMTAVVLDRIEYQRNSRFHDSRRLIELEAQAHEEMAEILLDLDQPEDAAGHLRQALILQETNFFASRRPVVFIVDSNFDRDIEFEKNYQASAFCSYGETQLKLANILRKIGRPYEAEQLLGECVLFGNVLCASQDADVLRYMLFYGRAWSQAAELFADNRPVEAEGCRRCADYVWQAVITLYPETLEHPEVPATVRERLWQLARGTAHAQLASTELYRQLFSSPIRETVFIHHALGLSWLNATNVTAAIAEFEKSAALRTSEHFYDSLQMAICHAKLGDDTAANKWLSVAKKTIKKNSQPEIEALIKRASAALH